MSMLIETLKEIDSSGAYSKSGLAKKLDTQGEVVDHILSQLESMGYIAKENINASGCSSCPSFKNGCMGVVACNPIYALTVTGKGKKLLERQQNR
ncbi:MAG: DNA-binding protein [Clostridiales bacterium]|nr:DNA-binding protein [Clostridiales bacterium]